MLFLDIKVMVSKPVSFDSSCIVLVWIVGFRKAEARGAIDRGLPCECAVDAIPCFGMLYLDSWNLLELESQETWLFIPLQVVLGSRDQRHVFSCSWLLLSWEDFLPHSRPET